MGDRFQAIAIIPARLESTRLPEKLLLDLKGKPLIQRVYENVKAFHLFREVYVVTDSKKIGEVCKSFQAAVVETHKGHNSGTSRVAEAAQILASSGRGAERIVNIQGDEPFLQREQIEALLQASLDEGADIATLVTPSKNAEKAKDPNVVKVVSDLKNRALYFSRHSIPFQREGEDKKNPQTFYHHVGVYAFSRSFLEQYPSLTPSPLEEAEKLEQLRFLANGFSILLVETPDQTIGIDTQEDLEAAKNLFKVAHDS